MLGWWWGRRTLLPRLSVVCVYRGRTAVAPQETQLYLPRQHPGHLDAMELWRVHVLFWIDTSRRQLCAHCGKLEADAKMLTAAHLARGDVGKMAPGMIDSIEGAVAPLVSELLRGASGRMQPHACTAGGASVAAVPEQ